MKLWKQWQYQWKRQLMEDAASTSASGEAGASGGGGSGGGTGGEAGASGASGASEAAKPETVDKAEYERLKSEHERISKEYEGLSSFQRSALQHLEIGEDGNVRPKIAPPKISDSEQRIANVASTIAEQKVQASEKARAEESRAMERFKADPLFVEDFPKAREYIEKLPAERRTKEAWDKAMEMARGGNLEKRTKLIEEAAYKKGLAEGRKQRGAGMDGGEGGLPKDKDGNLDISQVTLSDKELVVAQKMVKSGMIKNIDAYKRNKLLVSVGTEEE